MLTCHSLSQVNDARLINKNTGKSLLNALSSLLILIAVLGMASCDCENTMAGGSYRSKYTSLLLDVEHREDRGIVVCKISNYGFDKAEDIQLYYENVSHDEDGKTVLLEEKTTGTINLGDIETGIYLNKIHKELKIDFKDANNATFKFELRCDGQPILSTEGTYTFFAPPISLELIPVSSFDLIEDQQKIQFKIGHTSNNSRSIDLSKLELAINHMTDDDAYISKKSGGTKVEKLTGADLGDIGNVITLFVNTQQAEMTRFALQLKYDNQDQSDSKWVSWRREDIRISEVSSLSSKKEKNIQLTNYTNIIDPSELTIELTSNNSARFTLVGKYGEEVGPNVSLAELIGSAVVQKKIKTDSIKFKVADARGETNAQVTITVKHGNTALASLVLHMDWKEIELTIIPKSSFELTGRARKLEFYIQPLSNDSSLIDMSKVELLITNELGNDAFLSRTMGGFKAETVSVKDLGDIKGAIALFISPQSAERAKFRLQLKYKGKVQQHVEWIIWKKNKVDNIKIYVNNGGFLQDDIASFKLQNSTDIIDPSQFTIELTSHNSSSTFIDIDGNSVGHKAVLSRLIGPHKVWKSENTSLIQFSVTNINNQQIPQVKIVVKHGDIVVFTGQINLKYPIKVDSQKVSRLEREAELQIYNTTLAKRLRILNRAKQAGRKNNINEILTEGTSQGGTILHEAFELSKFNQEIVDILLSSGADIDARNVRGFTPLHLAIEKQNIEAVNYLLASNASVDIQDENGDTPMHKAAAKGNVEIVKLLLKYNPNLSLRNNAMPGRIALDIAETQEIKDLLRNYQSKRKP